MFFPRATGTVAKSDVRMSTEVNMFGLRGEKKIDYI